LDRRLAGSYGEEKNLVPAENPTLKDTKILLKLSMPLHTSPRRLTMEPIVYNLWCCFKITVGHLPNFMAHSECCITNMGRHTLFIIPIRN
jgi:hypothetical protein